MANWAVTQIVLNEEPWIKCAIDSTYKFASKIIIVHGSVEHYFGADPKTGLSTDKTKAIIEGYPDISKKIVYVEVGRVKTKNELRNRCLSYVTPDIDWILVQDADEMYGQDQLDSLNYLVEHEDDDLACIMNNQYWFWKDANTYCDYDKTKLFNRIYAAGGKMLRDISYEDKYGNVMVNSEYHERIIRNLPGLNYNKSHVNISDANGEFLYSQGEYRARRLYLNGHNLRRYHYSYVRSLEDIKNRFRYYVLRENPGMSLEQVEEAIRKDRYLVWLEQGETVLADKFPELTVKKFEGKHPECVKDHPWIKEEM